LTKHLEEMYQKRILGNTILVFNLDLFYCVQNIIVGIEMTIEIEEIYQTHQGLENELNVEKDHIETIAIEIMNASLVMQILEKGWDNFIK